MSVRAAADRVHDALSKVLAANKIPASSIETGETLLKRLKQPVRVTLMGLPKSGKSTVANLLMNDIVSPELKRWRLLIPTRSLPPRRSLSKLVCLWPHLGASMCLRLSHLRP